MDKKIFNLQKKLKAITIIKAWLGYYQNHCFTIVLPHGMTEKYRENTLYIDNFQIKDDVISIYTDNKKQINIYGKVFCEVSDNEFTSVLVISNFSKLELYWYYPNGFKQNRPMKKWTFYEGITKITGHKTNI